MRFLSPESGFRRIMTFRLLMVAWGMFAVVLASGFGELLAPSTAMADESVTREDIRRQLRLVYNHPNPFNPSTTIKYSLLQSADVQVHVYDLQGHHLVCLVDEYQQEGDNFAIWKTQTAPSGTYIFSLEADGVRVFRKMMLVR